MLTEEETENIKEQLLKQIENFPEEQRKEAIGQIESMDSAQLEEFLEKNKLIKNNEKCLFCSIADEEIPSYKIAESEESIAILDINPVSKGQILVIPKLHKKIEESDSMELAQNISKLLKKRLKPEDIRIETTSVQGHGIINVIPIYKGKKLEKKKAEDKEMYELQQILIEQEKTEEKEEKKSKEREIREPSDLPKAPRRIP